ncbi:MAG: DUF3795 domain-containing protein [Desulfatibacillum sp.]|nr:DUF3795 domain-containing protein [Desulfatibacillum sp.]
MEEMVAYCGLVCTQCPAFIATQKDDDSLREKTAAFYAKEYGFTLKPEEINCDGCLPREGRKIGYCATCDIRACGREKELENCAHCQDLPCSKLDAFHNFSTFAKDSFEKIRQSLKQ